MPIFRLPILKPLLSICHSLDLWFQGSYKNIYQRCPNKVWTNCSLNSLTQLHIQVPAFLKEPTAPRSVLIASALTTPFQALLSRQHIFPLGVQDPSSPILRFLWVPWTSAACCVAGRLWLMAHFLRHRSSAYSLGSFSNPLLSLSGGHHHSLLGHHRTFHFTLSFLKLVFVNIRSFGYTVCAVF